MGTIELTSKNYRSFLPLEIVAFSYASSGAMGDAGGVVIVTTDCCIYYFNYVWGDIDEKQMEEILPITIPADIDSLPDEWYHMYLGCGNNLFVKQEYAERLRLAWQKYEQTLEGRHSSLYNAWPQLVTDLLK